MYEKVNPTFDSLINNDLEQNSLSINEPGSAVDEARLPLNNFSLANKSEKYSVEFEGEIIFNDSIDWRSSKLLKLQIIACYSIFTLFGLAEQALGTLIPKLQTYYRIDDVQTSFIFLASVAGYLTMALMNEYTHKNLGIQGVVTFGCASMTLCYLAISCKPPYPLFIICYTLNGIGFGSLEASLNMWMGNLIDSNQLLGILHGCYGIGCMISPPLITALLEKSRRPWSWNQYYILLSIGGSISLILTILTFKHETPKKYKYNIVMKNRERKQNNEIELDNFKNNFDIVNEGDSESESQTEQPLSLLQALKSKLVWLFSIILFIYVGGEVAFGQWLITFLIRIKKLSYKHSSYMATSFWTGLTLGRIVLGFVTANYFKTELVANLAYIIISFFGYMVFWMFALVQLDFLLFIIVFITGLFVGPIFPTTIMTAIKILPIKYHTSGVGFICAFGGGGAAALPFLIGLIAESNDFGLKMFPLIVLILFGILTAIWLGVLKKFSSTYGKHTIN